MSGSGKLIINAAITGIIPTRRNNPHVPVTEDQIVATARSVMDGGASMVHIHARDEEQLPSYEPERYVSIVNRIRQCCPGLIVCVSLSGRFVNDVELRAAPLACAPDMASLTLGSMNFPKHASMNPPEAICQLARLIYSAGAVPELEAFDTGFVNYSRYLIEKGVLRPP